MITENKDEITIYDVISKKKEVSRKADTKLIMKAYNLAAEKHKDQKRGSGEPYIIHPLNVAYILASIGMDDNTLCAAILHDVVEDTVLVGNVMLKLSDTAGIRDTDNEIEKIGVQKTFDKINGAGLVIALFDNNEVLNSEDIDLINKIKDMPCIAVINKIDLEDKVDKKYITDNIEHVVYISAKQQDNIDELKNMIEKIAGTEGFDPSAGIIANERQRNAIRNAVNSLYEAKESLAMGMTMDAITVSLQETIDYLLELTGEKAGEEIVDSVFHNFCVGK